MNTVRVPFTPLRLTPLTSRALRDTLRNRARTEPVIVGNHNLHSVYLCLRNPQLETVFNSFDYVIADGFPILVAASVATRRLLSPLHRVGSLDWIPQYILSPNCRRVALIGSTKSANEQATRALQRLGTELRTLSFPGAGWNDDLEDRAVQAIEEFQPDLVLVGTGMPRQEQFLARRRSELYPAIYATVGGAIDQLGGAQVPAPRWLGRIGLEWAWRFASQPRRLAFRYTIEPLYVALHVFRSAATLAVDMHRP